MGLSGPRKRQKISHDPNNTTWSRNTTTFGHRILASQGWSPGQTLGPENAAQKRHLTTASTSHVRIALREDNLGLGAKPGSGQGPGQCTGLDSFQDLLGRLNGKTEAVIEKERQGRANVNRLLYAERKYGGWSRFISAGYLVGGESMEGQLDTTLRLAKDGALTTVGTDMTIASSVDVVEPKIEKRHRKEKVHASDSDPNGSVLTPAAEASQSQQDESIAKARRKEERAQRRAAKAQRKEDRRKRKEGKTAKMILEKVSTLTAEEPVVVAPSPPSRIITSGTITPAFSGGRHAVRAKYILQKKQAMLDAKALNEILMVKV